jgi:hypothetical protein
MVFALLAVFCGIAAAHDLPPDARQADSRVPPLGADVAYVQKQTDGNALGLVITNYGFFGNNLVTRSPSMEYPLGSQIEHLVRAGLWVGAINADGDTVVSTGSVTGYWGGSSSAATEFTPREKLKEKSILITSRAFSKDAVSEQDFICEYVDFPKSPQNEGILRVSVRQVSYLWSYHFAEAFVIVSFTVKNEGEGLLIDPCLGLYSELCSGWKAQYDQWRPPSDRWFMKKALEYFPEHRMCGEHHFNYDGGNAPSWGATAILGTRGDEVPPIDDIRVSFNWWSWYWETDTTVTDPYRYKLMRNGEIDETESIIPNSREHDAVELVSAGPFPHIEPGDSIVCVCAFVAGMARESLIKNVEWAQRAFDNDYVLPSPPQPPRFRIMPSSGRISIYWDDYPETDLDPFYKTLDFEGYRVYITRTEGATTDQFDMVREVDLVNGIGFDTGLESLSDTTVIDDSLYYYRLDVDNVKDGFKYWVALTSFDRGVPEEGVESMESGIRATRVLAIPGTPPAADNGKIYVVPNPYRGEAVWDGMRDREKYVWFLNLPEKATIRIFTLAGDLVKTIEFDGSTYDASDIQGLRTFAERDVAIPGGICAWDLITDEDQAVATGLYIYSVEDKRTGSNRLGKFMVIR